MTIYKCPRCHFTTNYISVYKNHLSKKKPCPETYSIEPAQDILKKFNELKQKCHTHQCEYCDKVFENPQQKHHHKKTCALKPSEEEARMINESVNYYRRLEVLEKKVESQQKQFIEKVADLNLKISLLTSALQPNKKEDFYQKILENMFNVGHNLYKNSVSNITTETFHAEIKKWDSWTEAVGQLIKYNIADPKEELRVYLFDTMPTYDIIQNVVSILQQANIVPYSIDCNDYSIYIKNLVTMETHITPLISEINAD